MKFILLFWLLDKNVLNTLVSFLKHTETKVSGSVHSGPHLRRRSTQSAQAPPSVLIPSTLSLKCGSAYQ